MSDYRITIKVRNARILRAMDDAGIDSIAELSRRCGVRHNRLGAVINLRLPPLKNDGQWRPEVLSMSAALGLEPEMLFSDKQRHAQLASNVRCLDAGEDEIEAMLVSVATHAPLLESSVGDQQELSKLLALLPERDREILERAVVGEETCEEVGKALGISGTRVRHIYARAIRKMRFSASAKAIHGRSTRRFK